MPFWADTSTLAPANVLHGAVRLQGFASSPTPDTHVRVACANAGAAQQQAMTNADNIEFIVRLMMQLLCALP
jgi:hypothetical protein